MLKCQGTLIAILIMCAAFTACERVQKIVDPALPVEEDTMPDQLMDEVLTAYKSWRYSQLLPAPPAMFTEAKNSGSAHGLGTRTVYIDGINHQFFYAVPAAIDAGTPVVFPTGMTIVKEIMDDTDTFVWRIAVMKKTADMMYADHNGWMYVQYQRDSERGELVATVGDGTESGSMGCHGCHAKAAHDSVFVTEIFLELGRQRLEAVQSGRGAMADDDIAAVQEVSPPVAEQPGAMVDDDTAADDDTNEN